jgi:hypothetical protein
MAVDSMPRLCPTCQKSTMQYRQGLNHIVHIAISLVTCGAWAAVYGFMLGFGQHWKCGTCGRKCGRKCDRERLVGASCAAFYTSQHPERAFRVNRTHKHSTIAVAWPAPFAT